MDWMFLILAGIFEIVWASSLKYTEGFTKLTPSIFTVAAMLISFWFLSLSLKTLPLSISYAVWTGIGIVGSVFFGILWLGEPASVLRLFFIILILIGIVGLKISM